MNKTLFAILFGLLIFVVTVLYFYMPKTRHDSNSQQTDVVKREENVLISKDDDTILREDYVDLQRFMTDGTEPNQQAYVQSVDKRLSADAGKMSDDTRNLLLLRKAIVLSYIRSDQTSKQNTLTANDILSELIKTVPTNEKQAYVKDFAIVVFTRLNQQNRYLNDVERVFPEVYKSIQAENQSRNKSFITLLALRKVMSLSSENLTMDRSFIGFRLSLDSQILTNYHKELSNVEFRLLINEITDDLSRFDSTKPITYTSDYITKLESNMYFALAYDIKTSYSKNINGEVSDDSTNQMITSKYHEVNNDLDDVKYNSNSGTQIMKLYNLEHLAYSLYRRGGYKPSIVSKEQEQTLEQIETLLMNNPAAKTVFDMYKNIALSSENKDDYTIFLYVADTLEKRARQI